MSISPQTTHDPDAPGETVPILETEHLSKVFPVRRLNPFAQALGVHAVEDASLALYPGRVTALVGESGSGKTTIARLLARVYDPTSGTIRFRGQPIPLKGGQSLREYRGHVQLVFQDPFGSLNAVHNVRYILSRPLRVYGHAHNQAEESEQVL